MEYTSYGTEYDYVVCISIDSVKRFWRAGTNDYDFYHEELSDLDWKPKEEAQKDLNKIAKRRGLKRR